MDTKNSLELRDESIYPDDKVLGNILKGSYKSYLSLLDLFRKYELLHEWRYYRDGKAWLCKVQSKKRTIVWMSAWNGFMEATIYFPEKDIQNVFDLPVSEETRNKIKSAKNVGRSKPCTFEIRDEGILNDFEKVMNLKIEFK